MNFLVYTINILLIGGIIFSIYKKMFLKEGLEGCPANSTDKANDRSRSAKREEIDNTIANMKAQIADLNLRISILNVGVSANKSELEKVSDAAAAKAKRNKEKMDKLK